MKSPSASPRTMRDIFSARSTVARYIEFEIALAQAQAACGVIPQWAAQGIAAHARPEAVDLAALERATGRSGFPVAPFVRQLTAICGEAGAWLHWGATTQDVLLSARALQVNEALPRVEAALLRIVHRLRELAQEHRDTPMAGRGFGGHSLPITFGLKVANWLVPCTRHVIRVRSLCQRPVEGEFGGAMGTLAALGTAGPAVQAGVLERLGLAVPAASASSARDAVAEALQLLALLIASLVKMAQDIAQLAWTEIGEVAEPPSGGRDTSSTLPHKANPVYSWQVMTSATLVQRNADLMLTAMRQEQERSGHGFLEGLAVPEAFIEAEACLDTLAKVLDGLQVDTARMRRNLGLTQGMVASEALQMALAAPLGRLAAHDLLHEACEAAARERRPLADVVADMPQITAHVPAAQVRELLDPERYLGMAALQVDRAVRAAEALQ